MPPAVSVVLTTYNNKPYIVQAIESVRAQHHTDFECLIIDDGSTDGTAQICQQYAEQDARIRVITQPNSGASGARNLGMREAKGAWLCFVDSDDLLHPYFLSDCLDASAHQHCDLVVCQSTVFSDGDAPDFSSSEPTNIDVVDTRTALERLLQGHYIPNVWARLYRRERLDGIDFHRELIVGEDMEFSVRLLLKPGQVCHINQPRYAYRKRAGSVLSRFKPELLGQRLVFCRMIREQLTTMDEPISWSAIQAMAAIHLGYFGMKDMVRSGILDTGWLNAMRQCLRTEFGITRRSLPQLGLPRQRLKWLSFALGSYWLASLFLRFQIRQQTKR